MRCQRHSVTQRCTVSSVFGATSIFHLTVCWRASLHLVVWKRPMWDERMGARLVRCSILPPQLTRGIIKEGCHLCGACNDIRWRLRFVRMSHTLSSTLAAIVWRNAPNRRHFNGNISDFANQWKITWYWEGGGLSSNLMHFFYLKLSENGLIQTANGFSQMLFSPLLRENEAKAE